MLKDNISGVWIGKFGGTTIGDIEVSVKQEDEYLSGQIVITNDPTNPKADFTGTYKRHIIIDAISETQDAKQQIKIHIEGVLRKQFYINGEFTTNDGDYGTFIIFRKDLVKNGLPQSIRGVKIDYPEYYGTRLVAFLDILGLRNIVKSFPQKPSQFQNILRTIGLFSYDQKGASEISHKFNLNWEYSIFSDSIIISAPFPDSPIFPVITQIGYVCFLLLGIGILIRGGIVIGRMFHKGNNAIGQGLIDAFEIESNQAFYPRIVITQKVAECLDNDIAVAHSRSIIPLSISKFYRQDTDGCKYIDYLHACSYYKFEKRENDYISHLGDIRRELIKRLVETESNTKHYQKVRWLANYLNVILIENPNFGIPKIDFRSRVKS